MKKIFYLIILLIIFYVGNNLITSGIDYISKTTEKHNLTLQSIK